MRYTAYDNDSVEIDVCSSIFIDHVSRYWWAKDLAAGKDVLDCACGRGYGTFILASAARSAIGVDLNPRSLEVAARTFRRPNLSYVAHDVLQLDRLGQQFDLITAFEIIEHIRPQETDAFLSTLGACLKPGGKLVLSTPNHRVVTLSGSPVPEYHINNFTPRRLRRTLRRHFSAVTLLGQYCRRGFLYELFFTLDVWSLRHVLGGPLKTFLEAREAAAGGATATDGGGPIEASATSRIPADDFETPSADVLKRRFSRWHWRQGGISLAICENPTPAGAVHAR